MRPFIFFLVLVICPTLPAQFSVKNQLEWTDWHEYDRRIVENWTDVSFSWQETRIGGRYEINYPPDPFIYPQDSLLKQFDLTFLYAEYHFGSACPEPL